MNDVILSLNNVSFTYDTNKVLDHINLDIKKGSFMGMVGPNGGGKTTLIKIILGELEPDEGQVKLFGHPLSSFKDWTRIGFVSQKANSFNHGFPATVFEVVAMGLTAKIGYFKFLKRRHKQKILEAIEQVDMSDYTYQNISELSGGQQQRIFIARALVNDPDLLILDEPTVGIDFKNVERFYQLLHRLNEERQITLLLVTHDTGAMTEHATDIVCLNKKLHFHGDSEKYTALTENDLTEIYGHPVHIIKHNH